MRQQRVERGDDRLIAATHEVEYSAVPFFGIQAELVLHTHDVARAIVDDFRGQALGVREAVVNDMDHSRVLAWERAHLLNRRDRRNALARSQIHRIDGILRERC